MSDIAGQMQGIVYAAAEPIKAGEMVSKQILRAWVRLGRPAFWRVRAAWYGEAGCWSGQAVKSFEERDAKRRRREETARAAARELGTVFAVAADRLRSIDPDFYREQIAGHELASRELGALDSPLAEGDQVNLTMRRDE